jgi:Tol biopolymer transport system component
VTPAITLRGLGRWFALSPDASRLVRYKVDEHTRDVWVENLAQHKSTRVSFTADVTASATGDRLNAVWSNDGRWIAYAAGTPLNVYVSSLDGTVKDRRLTTSDRIQWPSSWAPGDRALAIVEVDPLTGQDIKIVTLDANRTAHGIRPFLSTPFSESAPMISPGGEWLAYQSNESGRYEVYVQPYPDGGQRLQVSADNGVYPRWSRKGNELFFRSGANRAGVASATITGRGRPQAPPARVLFERRGVESVFDVSADDQRFLLMPTLASSTAPKIDILANWFTSRGR